MEDQKNNPSRPVNPRRRKPTPMQIFKEVYLPVIIAGLAVILVFVFIIGSIVRGVQRNRIEDQAAQAAAQVEAGQIAESKDIAEQAKLLAANFDYAGAITLINGFSGNLADYPELTDLRDQYQEADAQLVTWDDPDSITFLSFNMLLADPARAFSDDQFSSAFRNNYITAGEFASILEELYDNGYILVNLNDFTTTRADDNGNIVSAFSPLKLPAGKKPLVIVQTNVNYDAYLVDSDDDGYADQGGCGLAHCLVLDNNKLLSKYIDADGNVMIGYYDLIPLLEAFVEAFPDFSYRGAKAVIALTGDDGLFGYRTTQEAELFYGTAAWDQEVANAKIIADALKEKGYELACNTYSNSPYGDLTMEDIQKDVELWNQEVAPIIGEVNTFVFAQNSDLLNDASAEKRQILLDAGFNCFMGFCPDGVSWASTTDAYLQIGRILVNGSNLTNNPGWFEGMLDPAVVLDAESRG